MSFLNKPPCVVYWLGNNLYLNITNRCSNNCYFCFARYTSGINGFKLKLQEEPTSTGIIKELEAIMNRRPWREIVFCGFGEPLMRLDTVLEVTRYIKRCFHKTVRIDTNGQAYLTNRDRNVIQELKIAGVDKVSVSLNAHDKQTYNHVCRPKFENAFERVLEFIERTRSEFDVEVTAVTVPEVNISKVEQKARELQVKFRPRQYRPCFW